MHNIGIIEKCTVRDLGDGHRTVPKVGRRSSPRRGVQGTETKGVDHHSSASQVLAETESREGVIKIKIMRPHSHQFFFS